MREAESKRELGPRVKELKKIAMAGGYTDKQRGLEAAKKKMLEMHKNFSGLKPSSPEVQAKKKFTPKEKIELSREAPEIGTRQKPEMAVGAKESPAYFRQPDMKTAQGPKANRTAAKDQAYLMAAIARSKSVMMSAIMPEDKSPKDQFLAMNKSVLGVLENANLEKPDDCFLLSSLAGLMNKGFDGKQGGVGSFQNPGWKEEWSNLGGSAKFQMEKVTDLTWKDAGILLDDMKKIIGREDLTEKNLNDKLDAKFLPALESEYPEYHDNIKKELKARNDSHLEKNEKFKESFKEMLNYFENNLAQHFDPTIRHPAGVELASVQLQATLGQLVHDYLLESKMISRDLLKSTMIKNGLIDETRFEQIATFEKRMRDNPLLAEVDNATIKSNIALQLTEGERRKEMLDFLVKELDASTKSTTPVTELNSHELAQLAVSVLDSYKTQIQQLQTRATTSGERGRLPELYIKVRDENGQLVATGDEQKKYLFRPDRNTTGLIAKSVGGDPGEKNSFAVMPNRSDDKFATEFLALDNYPTQLLTKAIEGEEHILRHGAVPITILRLGKGLDSALLDFANNPGELLKTAIDENLKGREGKRSDDSKGI